MEALIVITVALCGLAALRPTEEQEARATSGGGHLQERLALLRQLGLVRH